MKRSNLIEVRNPVLGLPGMQAIMALPREQREALSALLGDVAADARVRADASWARHKAPMAAYWKAVAVYAGHTRRAIKRGTRT